MQSQISRNLGLRRHRLQDADGHIAQLLDKLRDDIRRWTAFPATKNLAIGQSDTYIINCPNLHSFTSVTLRRILDDANESTLVEVSLWLQSYSKEKTLQG